MTEIPEHLLKRSRERRAALGGAPAEGGAGAPGAPPGGEPPAGGVPGASGADLPAGRPAAAPAPAAAPRAEPPAPAAPPPKPVPAYIQAAQTRPKIPFWAMPVVAALPLWLFLYLLAMRPVEHEVAGPLGQGAEVYSQCASCHGTGGEGGVGYQLSNGEVNQSFDTSAQMHAWVELGTAGFLGQPYGNGRHIGGALGQMPAWGGQLSAAEIVAVNCHEFYTLGGADPSDPKYADDYAQWCAPDAPGYATALESGVLPAGEAEGGAAGGQSGSSGEGGNTSGGEG